MARIVFTLEDGVQDGKPGVSLNVAFDAQGANPDAPATPAMQVAAVIRRLWDSRKLLEFLPHAVPELVRSGQKMTIKPDVVDAEVVN